MSAIHLQPGRWTGLRGLGRSCLLSSYQGLTEKKTNNVDPSDAPLMRELLDSSGYCFLLAQPEEYPVVRHLHLAISLREFT